MKAICPKNPDHKLFITVAHVMHDWVVDENGVFVEDIGALETAHGPNLGNVWTCRTCGAEAKVEQ